uniref:Protein LTV1 homolog n=1 Tax=Callorhinchus milii TaxID=7868 RepID=V9KLM3_CALMI
MPHRKKKQFIEKKGSVKFHLVHRSQRDPLVADQTAPQRVLLPAERKECREKRKEEEREFGVFFDDDYNYLQHLKEASPTTELVASSAPARESRIVVTQEGHVQEETQYIPAPSINLPSSVFASEFEEETGLLNKAAPVTGPRLDLDPDIVAAMDEDFDFDNPENVLEDDFILQAVVAGDQQRGSEEEDDGDWEDVEDEEGAFDSDGPLSEGEGIGGQEFLFLKEETKSLFTDYSMTSSIMRRNDQLTFLDDRFERLFEEYDDDDIGALDHHELEGFIQVSSSRLEEVIAEYYTQKGKDLQRPDDLGPRADVLCESEESGDEEMEMVIIEEPREKWDCESILSTYSNLYNHPKLIEDPPRHQPITVSRRTGIPLNVLPKRGLTAKQLENMERINISDLPTVSAQPRQPGENKDQRKARKQAVREERRERRMEKKSNKLAFKVEKARQEKQMLNLRQNLQGIKL